MNRTLLGCAALLCLANAAHAQTTVTIYGILDAGFAYQTKAAPSGSTGVAGSFSGIDSGLLQASRFGLRGTEDLGGGLSALFALEGGIAVDNGSSTQGGALFGRRSVVGLSGENFGNLQIGRRKDFTDEIAEPFSSITPFGTFITRVHANNLDRVGGNRANNMLYYSTPVFSGFRANISVGFGETAGTNAAGRSLGYGAMYAPEGPFAIGFGYWESKLGVVNAAGNTSSDQGATSGAGCNTAGLGQPGDTCIKTWMIGSKYKLGDLVLRGAISEVKQPLITASAGAAPNFTTAFLRAAGSGAFAAGGSNNTKSSIIDVGGDYYTGPWKLKASYIQARYDFAGAATRGKLKQYLVGAEYNMSKRTTLYGTFSTMTASAMYSPGILATAPGAANSTSALGVGIRHTF
ncbi:porin [Polaromonas sp. YR568]|uniref:porin n=1 Tax=Polaromonas sp. YR568 TaxID=1855301 RepID=UPI00398C1C2B